MTYDNGTTTFPNAPLEGCRVHVTYASGNTLKCAFCKENNSDYGVVKLAFYGTYGNTTLEATYPNYVICSACWAEYSGDQTGEAKLSFLIELANKSTYPIGNWKLATCSTCGRHRYIYYPLPA